MSKQKLKITSKIILSALSSKHYDDVFIPECKGGESFGGCPRMDAWVMKKSWANRRSICYEIKVNRGDFINDNKWQNYLQYCNEFYFVCPSKLISVEEVPADSGLMYISTTGTRLFVKKKAPYRDIVVPEDLYRYLLMWRTKICRETKCVDATESNKTFWENWLIERNICKSLGHRVSKQLRKSIDETIISTQNHNESLEKRLNRYKNLVEFIEQLGVNIDSYCLTGDVRYRFKELTEKIPRGFKNTIIRVQSGIDNLLEQIELLEKDSNEEIRW